MLSESVGYKSYRAINLHYGKLARAIGAQLGLGDAGLDLLCEFFKPGEITNTEWVLVMREEFADGLRQAKWL